MSVRSRPNHAMVYRMETDIKTTEDLEDWAISQGLDPTAAATRIAYAQALRAERLERSSDGR